MYSASRVAKSPGFHVRLGVASLKQQADAIKLKVRGRGFHVRLSVAPLKHTSLSRLRGSVAAFPRSTERGSIEAGARLYILPVDSQFPRSTERGSIEATNSPPRP